MKEKLKSKGFAQRVPDKGDKSAVASYLNEEMERFISQVLANDKKVEDWYQVEKTRIRRQTRQE